jgi:hypothetical protein
MVGALEMRAIAPPRFGRLGGLSVGMDAALRRGAKRTVKELWRLIGKLVKFYALDSAPTIFAMRVINDERHEPESAPTLRSCWTYSERFQISGSLV